MWGFSLPIKESERFYADHPFTYFIFDTESLVQIFCGLVKMKCKRMPYFYFTISIDIYIIDHER